LDIAIFLVVALERGAFGRLAQYSGGLPAAARSTRQASSGSMHEKV
jgi:hypothetical protein